jgi:hypothetical protein
MTPLRKHVGVRVQTGCLLEQLSEANGKHTRCPPIRDHSASVGYAAIVAINLTTRFCAPGLNNRGVADRLPGDGLRPPSTEPDRKSPVTSSNRQ